jgi:alkylated DNA nucleotide flippase Atl1
MPLFEVNKKSKQVQEIAPKTFPELKLWERQDLEAWVLSTPGLAGGEFEIVTSEFDRFDKSNERLDVLGLVQIGPGRGRLVVIELKRDGTSTTVDLQAIKYAAFVAAVQFADVVEMYAHHHGVPEEKAREKLLDFLGDAEEDEPQIDDTPRIVLLAGDFRAEVTTTVLWLIDNFEMEIRCVRLQPYLVGDRLLVHSETIIPLPGAEQYLLGVQRKRRKAERVQEQKARAQRLLPQLVEAEQVKVGQTLYFRRDQVSEGATPPWSTKEALYSATLIASEGNRTMEWEDPDTQERVEASPSNLAARILHRLGNRSGEVSSSGINGMHYWTLNGEISLRDLGAEAGLLDGSSAASHVDRVALRALCSAIPAGRWTTYGDLATAIGVPGAAQAVAGVIATDDQIENAQRVLRSTGRISPGWKAEDGAGPESARALLEQEGLSFDESGAADPDKRWSPVDHDGG